MESEDLTYQQTIRVEVSHRDGDEVFWALWGVGTCLGSTEDSFEFKGLVLPDIAHSSSCKLVGEEKITTGLNSLLDTLDLSYWRVKLVVIPKVVYT